MVENKPAAYGIGGGIAGTYFFGLLGGLLGGAAGYYAGQRSGSTGSTYRQSQYATNRERRQAYDEALDEFSMDD